jgi:hypothetical protein
LPNFSLNSVLLTGNRSRVCSSRDASYQSSVDSDSLCIGNLPELTIFI